MACRESVSWRRFSATHNSTMTVNNIHCNFIHVKNTGRGMKCNNALSKITNLTTKGLSVQYDSL